MSAVQEADPETRAAILAVEEERRRALLAVDLAALADLYDDALVHIHAPGLSQDKAQLLEHVATRQAYLDMSRGELLVRVICDVAVLTGPLHNRLRTKEGGERTVSGEVTQVLRRCDDGRWRFVSFQMTPYTEQAWPALPSEQQRQKQQDPQEEER